MFMLADGKRTKEADGHPLILLIGMNLILLRGDGIKQIIDFHDEKVEFLDRQFKKRNVFYRKLQNNTAV